MLNILPPWLTETLEQLRTVDLDIFHLTDEEAWVWQRIDFPKAFQMKTAALRQTWRAELQGRPAMNSGGRRLPAPPYGL